MEFGCAFSQKLCRNEIGTDGLLGQRRWLLEQGQKVFLRNGWHLYCGMCQYIFKITIEEVQGILPGISFVLYKALKGG